jgi:hypothetical protein
MITLRAAYKSRAHTSNGAQLALNRHMFLAKEPCNILLEESGRHYNEAGTMRGVSV